LVFDAAWLLTGKNGNGYLALSIDGLEQARYRRKFCFFLNNLETKILPYGFICLGMGRDAPVRNPTLPEAN
jgi:hypothetical protein